MTAIELILSKNNNKIMLAINKASFFLILTFFLLSCEENRYKVDTAKIPIKSEQIRFDAKLKQDNDFQDIHRSLLEEHADFYTEYFSAVLRLGDPNQPLAFENIAAFLSDPTMVEIQNEITKSFGDKTIFKEKIDDSFKRLAFFFPNEIVPNVIFYNSGFNYGVYPTANNIGVGLDWYIGSENKLLLRLPPAQFPQYLRAKMNSNYLVSDILRGYLLVKYSDKIDGKELLNQLMYFGKIAFLMDVLLPDELEYLRYGYTESQMTWCQNNEFNIWKTLVSEDLLYSSEGKMINSFVGNAPFTKGFSDQSPGKLAFYIGKMMVEDYLDSNKNITPKQLLDIPSATILKAYRPNK
ncbi:MAG: hypothetical protein ACI8XB_000134 [Patiriisocius sp.]|jgi:hypothetical protein